MYVKTALLSMKRFLSIYIYNTINEVSSRSGVLTCLYIVATFHHFYHNEYC